MLYDTSFIYKKWQKKYSIVERLCSQSKKLVVLYNHFVRRKKWGSRKGVNEIPCERDQKGNKEPRSKSYFCDEIRVFSSHLTGCIIQ